MLRAMLGATLMRAAPALPAIAIAAILAASPSAQNAAFAATAVPPVKVIIGQAPTVLSTRHYQAYGIITCEGNGCNVAFPGPGPNHRLNLTHAACVVQTERGAQLQRSLLVLTEGRLQVLMTFPIPLASSPFDSIFYFNAPVDFQVETTQRVNVNFAFAGNGGGGSCTLTGTIDILK